MKWGIGRPVFLLTSYSLVFPLLQSPLTQKCIKTISPLSKSQLLKSISLLAAVLRSECMNHSAAGCQSCFSSTARLPALGMSRLTFVDLQSMGRFPCGILCLICADVRGVVAVPEITLPNNPSSQAPRQAQAAVSSHLSRSLTAGCQQASSCRHIQPCQGAPHPSQLDPEAPPPGQVSKQLEELTSRCGEAGLAQGAAETHVKAGRRSEARMETFARGNASNSSLMTLPLLWWKGSERLANEHNSLLKASWAWDDRVSDKNSS